MRKPRLELFLIVWGCLIFLFSLSFDWFYQGSPGVGFQQFVGMTIGFITILVGLRYLLLANHREWDWALFVMYLSGLFIVGLSPAEASAVNRHILFGIGTMGRSVYAFRLFIY